MTSCGRCGRERVVPVAFDDSIDACGHTFTAQLPATRCEACGQVVVDGNDVRRFENRIAVELAKAGLRTGAVFAYLRNALELEPAALAHLLDVPEEFVGYWERANWPIDPRAHSVLCSLVLARLTGKPFALDCLAVLREPRRLARKVRLSLGDAQARRALQFGSAARSAPASA
jgi:hypothetical protein